ncbi:hypothetical protein [Gordonia terrae]|uniref:hypothetical protein n=1 Tax=Gordonia terrae TaxID=2055 RepID=UPI003F6D4C5A
MTTSPDGIAAEFDAAWPGRVHPRGPSGHRESLRRIFFPDATRDTLDVLATDAIGVHSVEVRPGVAETEQEAEAAFGGNPWRLRLLRDHMEPGRVLGVSPL